MAIPGSYRRALGQLNVGVPAPQSAYLKDLLAAAVGGPTGFNTDGNLQAGLNTEGNPLYGGLLDRTFSSPVTRARDPFHWQDGLPKIAAPSPRGNPFDYTGQGNLTATSGSASFGTPASTRKRRPANRPPRY